MSAWQEFCEWRRLAGLPQLIEDLEMTQFCQMKAEFRAMHRLKDGHDGPQPPTFDWHEGTGEATSMWGWLTCEMESEFRYGGAGIAMRSDDPDRYMVLVVRDGSGRALIPRENVPVFDTSHLTPNPPVVDVNPVIGPGYPPFPDVEVDLWAKPCCARISWIKSARLLQPGKLPYHGIPLVK